MLLQAQKKGTLTSFINCWRTNGMTDMRLSRIYTGIRLTGGDEHSGMGINIVFALQQRRHLLGQGAVTAPGRHECASVYGVRIGN